jgi:hypothetical protein
MRGWVTIVLGSIQERLWPRAPEPTAPEPISEEEKQLVEELENQLRQELARAQTEAMRFRVQAGRHGT